MTSQSLPIVASNGQPEAGPSGRDALGTIIDQAYARWTGRPGQCLDGANYIGGAILAAGYVPLTSAVAHAHADMWQEARAAVAAGGWRPIETAPRDGTVIICAGTYPNGVPYVDTVFWSHEHWWGRKSDAPTHWQPMPEPPQ